MVESVNSFSDVVRTYNQLARENDDEKGQWSGDVVEFGEEYDRTVLDEIETWVDEFEDGGLSNREARVAALKVEGFTHNAIAHILGVSESTVDEYSRRVRGKIDTARALLGTAERSGLEAKYR